MGAPALAAAPPADFGSRFSAFMIDAAILFAVQWLVVIVLARQLQAVGFTTVEPCQANAERLCEGPSSVLWVLLLLILLVTTIAYHAFFEGRFGATPGKKWMGLRVRRVDADSHDPVGFATATLRSVVRQAFWLSLFFLFDASPLGLSLPPVIFIMLPVITLGLVVFAAVAPDGRGVHDIVAGTQVVRAERAAMPADALGANTSSAFRGEITFDTKPEKSA